jgi:calcium-dependent protein kinase
MVMKAKRKATDEIVAIKLIKKNAALKADSIQLAMEVNNLVRLDHPNIIKLHEVYENKVYLFLVQEYCACSFIDFVKKHNLKEESLRVVVKQLLSALQYCHKIGVIHRDIKFQNVMFLDANDITSLKLIDFGLSGSLSKDSIYQAMGTAVYIAPEVITGDYDEKADLWSLGILLYYSITGIPPFMGRTTRELYQNIVSGFPGGTMPKLDGASPEVDQFLT